MLETTNGTRGSDRSRSAAGLRGGGSQNIFAGINHGKSSGLTFSCVTYTVI
jgi:hypothetical protein